MYIHNKRGTPKAQHMTDFMGRSALKVVTLPAGEEDGRIKYRRRQHEDRAQRGE